MVIEPVNAVVLVFAVPPRTQLRRQPHAAALGTMETQPPPSLTITYLLWTWDLDGRKDVFVDVRDKDKRARLVSNDLGFHLDLV